MKSIIAIAALSAATFGLATQADAFKLSPPSTNFTAQGTTTLTSPGFPPLTCTSTFSGKTTATGRGKITGFSAVGDPGCNLITAALPWGARAISATKIKFTNVSVSIAAFGIQCGPGTVVAHDNANGQVTFNATLQPGNCMVSGTVQSTPAITIVP